jgi:hypothetical protein
LYRCAKQHSEPGSDKRGAKADEIQLTPLELIDRIAALVPPRAGSTTSWSSGLPTAATTVVLRQASMARLSPSCQSTKAWCSACRLLPIKC